MVQIDFAIPCLDVTDPEMVSFFGELYRGFRYLKDASDQSLRSRLEGLLASNCTLDFDGNANFKATNGKDTIGLVELLEEFKLRNLDAMQTITDFGRRLLTGPRFSDLDSITKTFAGLHGRKCLFKYLKREHVDALLDGYILFKAASLYKAPHLNAAIKDDELQIDHLLQGLCMVTANGTKLPVKGSLIRRQVLSDYYVSSFSGSCNAKMFALLGYDACVAIKDGEVFRERVVRRYQTLHHERKIYFNSVEYIDTFRQLVAGRSLEFLKSCDFAYQQEYRFVAFPTLVGPLPISSETLRIDMTGIECAVV
jgi:hypothetical protein